MANLQNNVSILDITQGRRTYDCADRVSLLQPNQTPIYSILARLESRKIVDPKFYWSEDALLTRSTTTSFAYGTSETSIVVADASIFVPNDVIQITATGENILIGAVTVSTNTLSSCVRGLGDTTPTNIGNAAEVLAIGPAVAESATSQRAVVTQVLHPWNVAQIFRKSVDVSETLANSKLVDSQNEVKRLLDKAATEFKRDIERAFLYGARLETTSGGKGLWYTGGLATQFITTLNTSLTGGSLTLNAMNTWLKSLFENGSDTRYIFGSSSFMHAIANIAEGKLETRQGDSMFGLDIKEWVNPFGKAYLVLHRDLRGTKYGSFALGLDMANLRRAVLRDVQLKTNIQANDSDTVKAEYISQEGIEVKHESTHGIIRNFTVV